MKEQPVDVVPDGMVRCRQVMRWYTPEGSADRFLETVSEPFMEPDMPNRFDTNELADGDFIVVFVVKDRRKRIPVQIIQGTIQP